MSATPATLKFSGGTLVLEGYESRGVPELGAASEWMWDNRVRAVAMPDAIAFTGLRLDSRFMAARIVDTVPPGTASPGPSASFAIRPDQEKAVACWNQSGRGSSSCPPARARPKWRWRSMRRTAVSTLVVSPVRDLMYQWQRRIRRRLGYDAGIIGDNVFCVRPVSVTTYDSACIHMERLGDQFGMIVFDECHHLPGGIRRDAARMMRRRLGGWA